MYKIDYAVLNGNTPLNAEVNYLGFDGENLDIEFSEMKGRRPPARPRPRKMPMNRPLRNKKPSGRKGGFRRFTEGLGISPEASQQRRNLRQQKQNDKSRDQRQNMQLQQQALQVAAASPTGFDEITPIIASAQAQAPIQTEKKGFWKSLSGLQKGLIIGSVVLVLGVGGYFIIKSTKR